MLEIITGRSGSGKSHYSIEKIKEALLAEPIGKAIVLLLPDYIVYSVEKELASLMAKEGRGYTRCHIYGFRRFAYQILQETGGALEEGITELGRQLLLKKILLKRRSELRVFGKASMLKGLIGEIGSFINELKGYDFSAENLKEIAEDIVDPRLKEKLQDLSLLYNDFNEAVEGKYHDGKDILCRLRDKIPQSEILAGADIWIDGFQYLSPLEWQIIEALLVKGEKMHFLLTADTENLQESIPFKANREDIFYQSLENRNRLLAIGKKYNKEIREIFFKGQSRYQGDSLRAIEKYWGIPKSTFKGEPSMEEVEIVGAATARLEIEAVGADIVRLVREKGYAWQDIGVLIRDRESYDGQINRLFPLFKIPFFTDKKRPCTHHPLAELIRSLLAICSSWQGWNYENIFRCLKTGFFPLSREHLDLLENYVLEFGIKGKGKWLQEEPWDYKKEQGNTSKEEAEEYNNLINVCRQRVRDYLGAFQLHMEEADTTINRVRVIYDTLISLKVPEQLEKRAKEAEALNRMDLSKEHQKVWGDIITLFDQLGEIDQLEDIKGERPSLQEFVAMVEEGLDTLDISMIPPGIDYVEIGDFDRNSLANKRAIYILGANAGIMPRHTSENNLLSDAERQTLNNISQEHNNKYLSLIGEESCYGEGFLLYKAFNLAKERLWVSYGMADEAGQGKKPAGLVYWLNDFFRRQNFREVLHQLDENLSPSKQIISGSRQSLAGLAMALGESRETGQMNSLWQSVYGWFKSLEGTESLFKEDIAIFDNLCKMALSNRAGEDKLPREIANKLFTKQGVLRGSVTKFEKYNMCPFSFFSQYGLRLQERKISRFQALDIGNLLHGVLKEFGELLQGQNRHWADVSPEEQQSICHEIVEGLAKKVQNGLLYSTKQLEFQLGRIERTALFAIQRLCAFDKVSKLHPILFEKSFGLKNGSTEEKALELIYDLENSRKLELIGQIDRIDAVDTDGQKYFMIIDYKTGQAAINIMDVYYGIKLQLLTYLLVAKELLGSEDREKPLAIGMLYYFLKRPLVKYQGSQEKTRKKLEDSLKMPGWIIADKDLALLIDSTLSEGESSSFIHASLTKGGELKASPKSHRTKEEFEFLLKYIEILLKDTGNAILKGHIQPVPYKGSKGNEACTYCPYHVLCGFDHKMEGFSYRSLGEKTEEGCLEKIQQGKTCFAEEMDKN